MTTHFSGNLYLRYPHIQMLPGWVESTLIDKGSNKVLLFDYRLPFYLIGKYSVIYILINVWAYFIGKWRNLTVLFCCVGAGYGYYVPHIIIIIYLGNFCDIHACQFQIVFPLRHSCECFMVWLKAGNQKWVSWNSQYYLQPVTCTGCNFLLSY